LEKTFSPVRSIRGTYTPPGDKSIAHRALLLGAMAAGRCSIFGVPGGDAVAGTADCLAGLGVEIEKDGSRFEVGGKGWEVASRAGLDARNSATTMRLLAGALAGRDGKYVLSGDRFLSRRPMDRVAEPLREMGAEVELASGRFPPVAITGGGLTGIRYELPVPSAQVKSAILLAGLQAAGRTEVVEPQPTRDHTERMLEWLGVAIERTSGPAGAVIAISEPAGCLPLPKFEMKIPGDLSSAAFLIVAALLASEGELRVTGVGLNPTRDGVIEILRSMGADLEKIAETQEPEPAGTIVARPSSLHATDIDAEMVPRTIDELPLLAVAAAFAEGRTTISGASELRVKESDRIAGTAQGLRALGATVEETEDGLVIDGPCKLGGATVDPKGDHRLALCFAIAGLCGDAPVTIAGWESSSVSYPEFEADLAAVAG
jgi:3-phosphoshikimate 1-carboxyvinyltransferase